ncbi:hypothetical protein ALC62_11472 [Cyphomyrmex costatus]|uniref:Uncharacterized protein n=1 Tax=Cyphomyrmex costatus TaxID=456900 RepID=A0A151ICK8_9HYME|nr:hypothetical protein ALC62_11472 [Cyphomyrmex costatus]
MDRRTRRITAILLIITWIQETYGIIGYDCGSASTNLTTLSLVNIEECDIPQQNVNSSKVYVQLLQLNDFKSVRVIQCKIELERTVKKFGMFSHTMDVNNGQFSYITEVSRDTCKRMHTYGNFEIAGTHITGLISNQTASRPVVLAGQVDNDGTCSGGAYSDPYGTWGNVIVLGSLKITLQDYTANVRINGNRVLLRSGVSCELSATHCTDIEGGDTYWDPVPVDHCRSSDYGVLYNGYAYGWSVYLLEAIWDSLTQLLLHLGKNKPTYTIPNAPEADETPEHNDTENREVLALTEIKTERTYPPLPPVEPTAYTLELRN